jgi:hypothetical protein
MREGEVRVRETQGGGGVRARWGIPGVTQNRRRRRGSGTNGASSGGKSSRLFPSLEEFAPRKDNFNHNGLDGTSLDSSGLMPLPGQSRRVKQHEALSGSLVSPIVAFFIDGEN